MTIHDPTPYNMALVTILKKDLHYIQRAARRANKKEVDLLHDIIEKHRRPGAAANEGGRKPPDSTKDEDQHRNLSEEKHVINTFRGHVFKNTHPEPTANNEDQQATLTGTEGGFMVDRQMIRRGL